MIGLKGIAKRAVFVIDRSGTIRHREVLDDAQNSRTTSRSRRRSTGCSGLVERPAGGGTRGGAAAGSAQLHETAPTEQDQTQRIVKPGSRDSSDHRHRHEHDADDDVDQRGQRVARAPGTCSSSRRRSPTRRSSTR